MKKDTILFLQKCCISRKRGIEQFEEGLRRFGHLNR